jgi:Ulp1 family protease
MSPASNSIDLFGRDFIIAPFNNRKHWSIVVGCYLDNIGRPAREVPKGREPVYLHLDSLRGYHPTDEFCEYLSDYLALVLDCEVRMGMFVSGKKKKKRNRKEMKVEG